MRVVSNAGPLIHLSWIDRLDLLRDLFQRILIPRAVRDEVLQAGIVVAGVPAIQAALVVAWFEVRMPRDTHTVAQLMINRDWGESETIALMEEMGADQLLLDDRMRRAVALEALLTNQPNHRVLTAA